MREAVVVRWVLLSRVPTADGWSGGIGPLLASRLDLFRNRNAEQRRCGIARKRLYSNKRGAYLTRERPHRQLRMGREAERQALQQRPRGGVIVEAEQRPHLCVAKCLIQHREEALLRVPFVSVGTALREQFVHRKEQWDDRNTSTTSNAIGR